MKAGNYLARILCGAGLAIALTIVPTTWALSPTPHAPLSAAMLLMPSQTGAVDINTASADQLKSLPGIGDAYAKRIIQNRPYSGKDQLVTKGVLPQGVYDKIKGQIVAHHMKK